MHPTTETARELKLSLKESLNLVKQLADEIRVDLHLGGMEAKQRWHEEFEPALNRAELLAEKASAASAKALDEAVASFKEFRAALSNKKSTPPQQKK